MQSRLSALLLKSTFTMEDIKEETQETSDNIEHREEDEVDEEYEDMFEQMEVVTDNPVEAVKTKSKAKTKNKNKNRIIVEEKSGEEYEKQSDDVEIDPGKENLSLKRAKTKPNTLKKLKKNQIEVDLT